MPLKLFKKKSGSAVHHEVDKEAKQQFALKCQYSLLDGPVYDVSGCKSGFLPDTCFTYCKLLCKKSLLIFDNNLATLDSGGSVLDLMTVEVFDLHNNQIYELPADLGAMRSLVKLDASHNHLKSLPSSFSNLLNLQDLNLSNNFFANFPSCLFSLPKLQSLDITLNAIKKIPKHLCSLQSTLRRFSISTDSLQEPIKSLCEASDPSALMKHLCELSGIEFVGLKAVEATKEFEAGLLPEVASKHFIHAPDLTYYLEKKMYSAEQHLQFHKEEEEKKAAELDKVLRMQEVSKKQLSDILHNLPDDLNELELKKQQQQQLHAEVDRCLRKAQDEEVEAYMAKNCCKENMIEDMVAQENNFRQEIEGIVGIKEAERRQLVTNLHSVEKNTEMLMREIIDSAMNKNAAFVTLLDEQDRQMKHLLASAAEGSSDIRKSEVVSAMQSMLSEAVLLEMRSEKIGNKQSWISQLIENSDHSEVHVKDLLTSRTAANKALQEMLLHDEQCQAAAFKLLLLNNDLQRSKILNQIKQVEQELVLLSSLEISKMKMKLVDDSSAILKNRKNLADMLRKLLSEKSDREKQLNEWLDQMEDIYEGGSAAADYWLLQYQRLMEVKPSGLLEAEQQLEEAVVAVITASGATEYLPILARHKVTFDRLLNMTEEEAAKIGIGSLTYASIQRALQRHLTFKKIDSSGIDAPPSAPEDDEFLNLKLANADRSPSAPPFESSYDIDVSKRSSSAPSKNPDENVPSAPPIDSCYVEVECVICLLKKSTIILLPCGHVCACYECSGSLAACPMCRADIVSKLFLGDEIIPD